MAYSSKKARGQAIQDLTVCMLFMYVFMYYTNIVKTKTGGRKAMYTPIRFNLITLPVLPYNTMLTGIETRVREGYLIAGLI